MLKFNRKTAAGAVEVDVIYSTIGKQAQGINVKISVILLALGGLCYRHKYQTKRIENESFQHP